MERNAAAADDDDDDGAEDAGSAASVASVGTSVVDDGVPVPRFRQVVVAREGVIAEHNCGKREPCTLCGALVWKDEDRNQLCCGRGRYILGPDLNPPITKEERAILLRVGMSRDSRIINNALAMGSISTEPSRERGGEGFVETGRGAPGGFSLHGKTNCATYGIVRCCSPSPRGARSAPETLSTTLLSNGIARYSTVTMQFARTVLYRLFSLQMGPTRCSPHLFTIRYHKQMPALQDLFKLFNEHAVEAATSRSAS